MVWPIGYDSRTARQAVAAGALPPSLITTGSSSTLSSSSSMVPLAMPCGSIEHEAQEVYPGGVPTVAGEGEQASTPPLKGAINQFDDPEFVLMDESDEDA